MPVEIPEKQGALIVERDESIRADTTHRDARQLKPVFRKEYGTVTAGNAPGLSDGAAATVVASDAGLAKAHDLPALARITGYAAAAIEPKYIFACPPRAVRKLLDNARGEDERLRRDGGQRGIRRAGARQRARSWTGTGQA